MHQKNIDAWGNLRDPPIRLCSWDSKTLHHKNQWTKCCPFVYLYSTCDGRNSYLILGHFLLDAVEAGHCFDNCRLWTFCSTNEHLRTWCIRNTNSESSTCPDHGKYRLSSCVFCWDEPIVLFGVLMVMYYSRPAILHVHNASANIWGGISTFKGRGEFVQGLSFSLHVFRLAPQDVLTLTRLVLPFCDRDYG